MSRKQRRRHHRNNSPTTKPLIRPADGWVLFQCVHCGAEFYYKPKTKPFCVNNCGQFAEEEDNA
jgi:hypothetical protein